MQVRDHRPLQQGLRLSIDKLMLTFIYSTRPSSTTTRIKTFASVSQRVWMTGTRPSSTTTRIKTQRNVRYRPLAVSVRVHRPLQKD